MYNLYLSTISPNSLKTYKAYPAEEYLNIIANLAIQSGSDSPDDATTFPSALEIDYIKYYKKAPCNVAITANSNSQLNLGNNNFNVIFGNSINLSGNIDIQAEQQIELVAQNEIVIDSEFLASEGSDFLARIDPNICDESSSISMGELADASYRVSASAYELSEESDSMKLSDNIWEDKFYSNIRVYPNPTKDILNIEVQFDLSNDYTFILTDQRGVVVYKSSKISSSTTEFDMSEFASGIYVLEIIDNETKMIYFNKVVKE